ncbi:MAG: ferrochelatase [Cellvibrio sp.]
MTFTAVTDNVEARFHAKPTVPVGILLANLGTPDAPTTPALRRYLNEFLSDPRVIELPKILWKIILHGIVLRTRPAKSAQAYQTVWTEEGSPLLVISRAQQAAVQQRFGEQVKVALGMRYGNPSIASGLQELREAGCRKIIVLPLYPQYAGATTGSTFDAVANELKTWRWVPELHFVNNYCDDERYIAALANTVREAIAEKGMPERLVFSYHGMPQRYFDNGDPYYCFCKKTTRLVQEAVGLDKEVCITTFQSRFGKEEWLKPYTDATLEELAKSGVKNLMILSPAFSADCLETIEELGVENRDIFLTNGGTNYHYIPALNTRDDHLDAIEGLLKKLI